MYCKGMFVIQREPEYRIDRNGRPWEAVSAKEVGTDPSECPVRIFAFDDAPRDELAQLQPGDIIAAAGTLKISPYTRDGERQTGITLIANRLSAVEMRQRIGGNNVRHLPTRKA